MAHAPISSLLPLPSADVLRARFVGQPITALPTPSLLLDRARLEYNCQQMLQTSVHWQCLFRAHIKTLKTREATAAMVAQSRDKAIIVSTMAEAWGVVQSGLVEEGAVKDILFGLPLGVHKIAELLSIRAAVRAHAVDADIKVLIDHPDQAIALQAALEANEAKMPPLKVFIKIDCGYMRAGLTVESPVLPLVVQALASASQLFIWGTYCHAGFSYGSKTGAEASSYLSLEMQSVNQAAQIVTRVAASVENAQIRSPLVLSVGSTPTAHAAGAAMMQEEVKRIKSELIGDLELHAGNYPVLDLQQVATNAVPDASKPGLERCAMTVLCTIVSSYPSRSIMHGNAQPAHADGRAKEGDEALCDGGGIAFSKDLGPISGYGHAVWPAHYIGWQLGRIAQEHGIMTVRPGSAEAWYQEWGYGPKAQAVAATTTAVGPVGPHLGDKVRFVPQHACMTAAAHHWFFVIDSSTIAPDAVPTVVDVWVPWKGW